MPLTSSSPTLRRPRRNRRSSRSESLPCVRKMDVCGGGGWFARRLHSKWSIVQVQDVQIKGSSPDTDQVQTAGNALLGNDLNWPMHHLPIKEEQQKTLEQPNQILQFDSKAEGKKTNAAALQMLFTQCKSNSIDEKPNHFKWVNLIANYWNANQTQSAVCGCFTDLILAAESEIQECCLALWNFPQASSSHRFFLS